MGEVVVVEGKGVDGVVEGEVEFECLRRRGIGVLLLLLLLLEVVEV